MTVQIAAANMRGHTMPSLQNNPLAGLSDLQWGGLFGIRSAVNEKAHI